ncbi:Hypothetical predicted protein [Paramuricea clavata]|uniref:Uncharacterized protein n=1 Tax=Paramuricea clavata TaxID=317549 RepID=A0A6S7FIZ2_PARCT|nr:Hypothetical predicted protein [Paramuricea clavata]
MAEQNRRSSSRPAGDEIVCFVHNLTPKKSGSMSYNTCDLQTLTANVKAVCFSPEKVIPLKQAIASKSPVKIKKFEFNEKFNNVVISRKSVIQECEGPIGFKCDDMNSEVSLIQVHSVSPGQLVTVAAQITQMSGVKKVKREDGCLDEVTAMLVDPTGSIKCVFFGEWVKCIEEGETYTFTNLRVRTDYLSQEKFVNTAKTGCKIETRKAFGEPLAPAAPLVADIATKEAIFSVVGIKGISKYYSCSSCSKKLEEQGTKLYCRSCNMKQKPTNVQWVSRLRVQDSTSDQLNITVFHPHMVKLFESQGKSLLPSLTESVIEDILLDVENIHASINIQQGKLLDILE